MSDRYYRFVLGVIILIGLFLELNAVIYLVITLMLAVFISNIRIPLLVSRLLNTAETQAINCKKTPDCPYICIDAERIFHLIVAFLLSLGSIFFIDQLWFFPWFTGLNLALTGISGICPMMILLRKIGFK